MSFCLETNQEIAMNHPIFRMRALALLSSIFIGPAAFAQTSGDVSLTAKLSDTGSGPKHWTAVWVTNASGAFIRTIRRQGPAYKSHWGDHCDAWYAAVAGNSARYTVAPDGFTSATATSYSAPISQKWDCTDSNGATIPDGNYKIWIQYSEDASQPGPVTTGGLSWTKGPAAATVNPADQGGNFTNMSIVWTPGTTPPPVTGPEIAVQQPAGSNLVDGTAKRSFGTTKIGKKGTARTFTIINAGTEPLTGIAITKSGANAKDFIVTAPAKTSLAAGAKTTFKVTFKPSAKGTRHAIIQIKSNDVDENPFGIKVAGQGVKKIKSPKGDDDGDDDDNDGNDDDDDD
jgi:hypothetical protein